MAIIYITKHDNVNQPVRLRGKKLISRLHSTGIVVPVERMTAVDQIGAGNKAKTRAWWISKLKSTERRKRWWWRKFQTERNGERLAYVTEPANQA
jgi:hypothetical protein